MVFVRRYLYGNRIQASGHVLVSLLRQLAHVYAAASSVNATCRRETNGRVTAVSFRVGALRQLPLDLVECGV